MDVINKAARTLNHSIDAVTAYLVDNGPAIVCLIVVMYFIRKSFSTFIFIRSCCLLFVFVSVLVCVCLCVCVCVEYSCCCCCY